MVSQGGWGWLVVGAAFLVQVLTTGLQLAFGVMAAQIARHFSRQESTAASSLHMEAGQFQQKDNFSSKKKNVFLGLHTMNVYSS